MLQNFIYTPVDDEGVCEAFGPMILLHACNQPQVDRQVTRGGGGRGGPEAGQGEAGRPPPGGRAGGRGPRERRGLAVKYVQGRRVGGD